MDRAKRPAELLLLEYSRTSKLLNDPAVWESSETLSSILLIATNGSVLAQAYTEPPRTIRVRAHATKYTATFAAYMNTAGNSEDEAVTRIVNGRATVIVSVTKDVLLAVTGKAPDALPSPAGSTVASLSSDDQEQDSGDESEFPQDELEKLITISEELRPLLAAELSQMRWPEDY